jgi:hypothetical protein
MSGARARARALLAVLIAAAGRVVGANSRAAACAPATNLRRGTHVRARVHGSGFVPVPRLQQARVCVPLCVCVLFGRVAAGVWSVGGLGSAGSGERVLRRRSGSSTATCAALFVGWWVVLTPVLSAQPILRQRCCCRRRAPRAPATLCCGRALVAAKLLLGVQSVCWDTAAPVLALQAHIYALLRSCTQGMRSAQHNTHSACPSMYTHTCAWTDKHSRHARIACSRMH